MQSLINIDQNVFSWFNSFIYKNNFLDFVIKILAVYTIYFIPLVFIFFWFYPTSPILRGTSKSNEKTKKFLIELFLVLVVSWQLIARFIGMLINRPRPASFEGAKELLFHPPTYAFPSDHALFLACITTYLYLSGYPKIGNIALILTILISISRVIAGFHFPGDILAGWIMGAILAYLFYKANKFIQKYFVGPIYNFAKFLKLA